jgi:hypothetical protein
MDEKFLHMVNLEIIRKSWRKFSMYLFEDRII